MKLSEGGSNSTELILTPEKIISQREIFAGLKNEPLDTTIGITRKDSFDPENINGKVAYERMIQSPKYRIFIGKEEELLSGMGADLIPRFRKDRISFWDYGCGNGTKATHLINPMINGGGKSEMLYFGVDISGLYTEQAAKYIEQEYKQRFSSYGIAKDFMQGGLDYRGGVNIAMFLGGTMGNYSDQQIKEIIDRHLYRHRSQKVVGVITLMKEVSGEKDIQRQLEAYGGVGEGYGNQQAYEDFSQFFVAWLRALQCDEKSLTCLKYNTWFTQDKEGQKLVGGMEVIQDFVVEPIRGHIFVFTKGKRIPMMVSRRFSPDQLIYLFGKGDGDTGGRKGFESISYNHDVSMSIHGVRGKPCENNDMVVIRYDNTISHSVRKGYMTASTVGVLRLLFNFGSQYYNNIQAKKERELQITEQIGKVMLEKNPKIPEPRKKGQTKQDVMQSEIDLYIRNVLEGVGGLAQRYPDLPQMIQDEAYNIMKISPDGLGFDEPSGDGYDISFYEKELRTLYRIIYTNQAQRYRNVGNTPIGELNPSYLYRIAIDNSISLNYDEYNRIFELSKNKSNPSIVINQVVTTGGSYDLMLMMYNNKPYAFFVADDDENGVYDTIYESKYYLSSYQDIDKFCREELKEIRKPLTPLSEKEILSLIQGK